MARPPLPRYRVDLNLVLEFSAKDLADADRRLGRLLDDLRPRLSTLVEARRVGACELVDLTVTDPVPAPDPEPLLERLTATREDLAP